MSQNKTEKNSPAQDNIEEGHVKLPDPVAFAHAMNRAYEKAQPVLEEYFENFSKDIEDMPLDPFNIRAAYVEFWNNFLSDPQSVVELQAEYAQKYMHLWQESWLKFMGEESKPVIEADRGDRRWKAKEWQESALFDFIKQSYLLTCDTMQRAVSETRGLKETDKKKLDFYTKFFADALSPSNFVLTNPEVLQETLKTGGENLVRGFENLVEDLKRGHGELAISTTDYNAFEIGKNIAVTEGSVVYENDLIQLIQYKPQTDTVFKTPLLIIPPWINKYYILDLRPGNSLIEWLVQQGHTVFTISWVNPDEELAQKRFEDYMQEGIIASLDHIEKATGEKQVNAIGYCLGGTLLTITLAWLEKQKRKDRIASATFLTTLIDFEHAGDMKLFMDDEQLALMDRDMAEKGVLQAKQLQRTFSMLRANDMIWSFVVNNYLMGKEPFPFDLLYWNDDSTNMPAAMHSFYLRKMYRDNVLKEPGGISMDGTDIDISKIKVPAYFLSTREDHIAPWRATYAGPHFLSGDVSFTLAASGHIAGVVNPPSKNKYCYWTSSKLPEHQDDWMEGAKEHEGSWWPHWQKWIKKHAGNKVPARKIKNAIEPAPGSYVKMRAL